MDVVCMGRSNEGPYVLSKIVTRLDFLANSLLMGAGQWSFSVIWLASCVSFFNGRCVCVRRSNEGPYVLSKIVTRLAFSTSFAHGGRKAVIFCDLAR